MKYLPVIFISMFLFTTVFGFVFMVHGMNGSDCIASAIGDTLCPGEALNFASYHIGAYQSFLSVVLSSFIISLIISIFLLFVCKFILFEYKNTRLLIFKIFGDFYKARLLVREKILGWLSLFENSPSLA